MYIRLLLLLIIFPFPAYAQLTAGATPSKTSGTAPLYVFFDGTTDAGTNHSDADVVEFRDLHCEWNFGDAGAGNWSTNGQSKNSALGCIAAHVYKNAGTYTARLTIKDEAGNERSQTMTINVTSGDTTWSGTNTVCVANSGGFTGCPSGALQIQSNDYDNVLASSCDIHDNDAVKRCLFRRGDTFFASNTTRILDGPIHIGAFGTGADPIIDASGTSGDFALHDLGRHVPAQSASNIRITDLEFRGQVGDQGPGHVMLGCSGDGDPGIDDILVMNNRIVDYAQSFGCSSSGNPYESPDKLAMIENHIVHIDHRPLGFFEATRTAFIANSTEDNARRTSHIRFSFGRKIIIQHNVLDGEMDNDGFKLSGVGAVNSRSSEVPSRTQQRFWLIADNYLECDGGDCIGGYNDLSQGGDSVLDHAVIERNHFNIPNGNSGRVAESCFAYASWRNNIFRAANDPWNVFIIMDDTAGDCLYDRDGIRVYNNTFYSSGPNARGGLSFNAENDDAIVRNNLYYSAGDNNPDGFITNLNLGDGNIESNNLQTTTNVFDDDGVFDEADDFRLNTSGPTASSVVDAGYSLSSAAEDGEAVYLDYGRNCRAGAGSQFDLGAIEVGASACSGASGDSIAPAPPADVQVSFRP